MFERFTDRSRRVLALAQEGARQLGHHYIATEHLLLGLLSEGGIARVALNQRGATANVVLHHIVELVGEGLQAPIGDIPLTPRLMRVLDLSTQAALALGAEDIGTEHLLLGLIDDGDGVAVEILMNMLGIDLAELRQTVIRMSRTPVGTVVIPDPALPGGVAAPAPPAKRVPTSRAAAIWAREVQRRQQKPFAEPVAEPAPEPRTVEDVDARLTEVVAAKDAAIDAGDFERAGRLRVEERDLLQRWAVLSRAAAVADPVAPPRRPDPGGRLPIAAESSLVLIGVAEYRDPELPDMPAARGNVQDLAELLTDPRHGGFDPARTHTFLNPGYDVAGQLAEIADETTDTLVVYYAGHGVVPADGQLYLCLPETRARREMYTSVPYRQLRRALVDSPARNRVVILDCCFAGRAIEWMSAEDGLAAGQLDVAGTYVLTATSATRPAHVPDGARNSAFTGALIGVLRKGTDEAASLIRLGDLYPRLLRTLRRHGLPLPQQRGSDTIGDLALTRNPAWVPG
jgi:hypothetical protein